MNEEVFAQAAGISIERSELVWPYMLDAMNEFDIRGQRRMAAFIAQTSHESAHYAKLREDTYYATVDQLIATFPSYFGPHKADAVDYVRSPKHLANYVYANRGGNGDYDSGDGWLYRAGGYIGITFRKGYRWIAELLELPLEHEPSLIEGHDIAALSAGAYWANTEWQGFSLNDYADDWNIRAISGLINRGNPNKTAAGLQDRIKRSEKALKVIQKALT